MYKQHTYTHKHTPSVTSFASAERKQPFHLLIFIGPVHLIHLSSLPPAQPLLVSLLLPLVMSQLLFIFPPPVIFNFYTFCIPLSLSLCLGSRSQTLVSHAQIWSCHKRLPAIFFFFTFWLRKIQMEHSQHTKADKYCCGCYWCIIRESLAKSGPLGSVVLTSQ